MYMYLAWFFLKIVLPKRCMMYACIAYLCLQVLIASIMASYNKDDWVELVKMADVSKPVTACAS